jgi:hypothetical protein
MEGAPLPVKDNTRYIKRDVKMPCKRVSLSLGAPLGNLEGIRLPGFFEEKRLVYLGSLLGSIGYYEFKSGGVLNFGKGTGLSEFGIRLWGKK